MRQPLLADEDGGAAGGLGGRHVQVRNLRHALLLLPSERAGPELTAVRPFAVRRKASAPGQVVGARNPSKHELCFALRDECDPRWYLFRGTIPTGVKVLAQLKAKRAEVNVSASWVIESVRYNLATLEMMDVSIVLKWRRVYWLQL